MGKRYLALILNADTHIPELTALKGSIMYN